MKNNKPALSDRMIDAILDDDSLINWAARIAILVIIIILVLLVTNKFISGAWTL